MRLEGWAAGVVLAATLRDAHCVRSSGWGGVGAAAGYDL